MHTSHVKKKFVQKGVETNEYQMVKVDIKDKSRKKTLIFILFVTNKDLD
jgi:hypothetical protein